MLIIYIFLLCLIFNEYMQSLICSANPTFQSLKFKLGKINHLLILIKKYYHFIKELSVPPIE